MDNAEYKRIKKNLESVTDKLGVHIDSGIMDAVIIFKMLGFNTTQSCEGHLSHGFISPWIQFGPKTTPSIKVIQNQIKSLKNQIYEVKEDTNSNRVHNLLKKINIFEDKLNKRLNKDLAKLALYLNEFYLTRAVAFDQKLIIIDLKTHVQLIIQGSQFQGIFSKKEKYIKLKLYQREYQEFVNYLKNKYL